MEEVALNRSSRMTRRAFQPVQGVKGEGPSFLLSEGESSCLNTQVLTCSDVSMPHNTIKPQTFS